MALCFAINAGFRYIILEGDNVTIVNAFKANEDDFTLGDAIVADISIVSMLCRVSSFLFVKWGENFVAHALAKLVKTVNNFIVWLEDPPSWIKEPFSFDIANLN